MAASDSSQHPAGGRKTRVLKIGVTSGSDFLFKSFFLAPSIVSVGRASTPTIPLAHPDVPEQHELFSLEEESCLLQFDRSVDLAFFYDGLFRRPNYLIDEGLAFRRGRNYYLNLKSRARGTITFGPYRLLFKLEMIDRPSVLTLPLPSRSSPVCFCAGCDQPLELALPRPGVLSRCSQCKRFSRFSDTTASGEPPLVPAPPSAPDPAPILLDQPVDGPPQSVLEEAATVLDAGVVRQMEESFGIPPGLDPIGPHTVGPSIEERDTGRMTRNELIGAADEQSAEQSVADESEEIFVSAAAAGGAPAERPRGGEITGAKIVPLPMSPSARRRVHALSSAPAHPAIREPARRGYSTDSYAAAKLADRLTLLIFALILIALLLACILGVLLVQGTLRHRGTPVDSAQTAVVQSVDGPLG